MFWFKQPLLKLETLVKSQIQLARIFKDNLDPYFIDFYAKFFFWSRNENRSLGREQLALPKLQSTLWHSCSEFKFGFWGGGGESSLKKKKGIRHP